jgi:hypothetical protein
MPNRPTMQLTALLAVFLSAPAYAAPPPGRAWECPISQRLRCAPRGCVPEAARGRVATIDPNGGYILPCNSLRGAEGECEAHDARFHPSFVRDELIGIALHGVSLSAVVRPDNSAVLTYVLGDTVYISRGQCHEAAAPEVVSPPAVVRSPR